MDKPIANGHIRVVGGGFMDYLGIDASHFDLIPFTYEPGYASYIEEPKVGLDFGLVYLDGIQTQLLAKNNVLPITRDNWIHQHRLEFDFYRMLGVPEDRVFTTKKPNGNYNVQLQPAMLAINRIELADAGEPPRGASAPSDDWFIGRIDPQCPRQDIAGMSGGPIFGFRKHADGRLTYHVVALQSRWWPDSRTIFGCSLPAVAEGVHDAMADDFESQLRQARQPSAD